MKNRVLAPTTLALLIFFCLLHGQPAMAARTAYTTRTSVEAYKSTVDSDPNQAIWSNAVVHLKNLSPVTQTVSVEITGEWVYNYLWLESPPAGMSGWTVDSGNWFNKTVTLSRSPNVFTVTLAGNAEQDLGIVAHCIWNKSGPACQTVAPPPATCIGNIPYTGKVDQRGNWSFVLTFRVAEDRGAVLGSFTTVAGLCGNRGVVQNGATFQINGGRPF